VENSLKQNSFDVQGTCSDNGFPVTVSARAGSSIGDEKFLTCSGGSWSTSLDFSSLAEGAVVIRAEHIDEAQNLATPIEVSGTKQTGSPALGITTPAPNFFVNLANQDAFEVSGSCGAIGREVFVAAVPSSGESVTVSTSCTAGSVYSTSLNLSGFPDGDVLIRAEHADAAGNPSVPVEVSGLKDTRVPEISIQQPQPEFLLNQASGTALAASGTCSEHNASVYVRSKSNAQTGEQKEAICTAGVWEVSALSFENLPDGPVRVEVEHVGAAGNPSALVSVGGRKDVTAPEITLIGDNPLELLLCGSFEDPGATAVDNIDGAVEIVVSGHVEAHRAGQYSLTYRAEDSAGNLSEETRQIIVQSEQLGDVVFERGLVEAAQFLNISNEPTENYLLCGDISFEDSGFSGVSGEFSGFFEGQAYDLSDLNSVLFEETSVSARLQNFVIREPSVSESEAAASLVIMNRGLIEGVHVYGGEVIGGDQVGGLVSVNESEGRILESSTLIDSVKGDDQVGGLVALNRGTVENSYSQSFVESRLLAADETRVGGLVGEQGGDDSVIRFSYSAGEVVCAESSRTSCDSTYAGGLVGKKLEQSVVDSAWDTVASGIPSADPLEEFHSAGVGWTTEQMQDPESFGPLGLDWDLDSVWEVELGFYPKLRAQ